MLSVVILRLLLSPSGAIDRVAFTTGVVLLAALAVGGHHALQGWSGPYGLGSFAFVAAIAWSAICLSRKRLHDFGWSGLVIPAFLGLYLLAVAIAIFVLDRGALASWQQALATFSLFSGPMVGWLIALAIIPGSGLASSTRTSW
ncbi:hypothetical protein ACETRX_07805 [Labrys portucalensis]|uniref:DUF805 domain-containing protein n=1 Tax=Labrys neptuniae TaxID=376174 RepID=A0ABV6ZBH9_9HYPH